MNIPFFKLGVDFKDYEERISKLNSSNQLLFIENFFSTAKNLIYIQSFSVVIVFLFVFAAMVAPNYMAFAISSIILALGIALLFSLGYSAFKNIENLLSFLEVREGLKLGEKQFTVTPTSEVKPLSPEPTVAPIPTPPPKPAPKPLTPPPAPKPIESKPTEPGLPKPTTEKKEEKKV